jgi:hypothetical protein
MTGATSLGFDPLLSLPYWIALGLAGLAVSVLYLTSRGRAPALRGMILALIALIIANPVLVEETREALPSVAAVVIDRSGSMEFGERAQAADVVRDAYAQTTLDGIELRIVETERGGDGTRLWAAAEQALSDVSPDRIAGLVLVTDGQIHDLPDPAERAAALGPIHTLLIGDPEDRDRRIEILGAPRYGIVGERAPITLLAEDTGAGEGETVTVVLRMDGQVLSRLRMVPGVAQTELIDISRRGSAILIAEVEPASDELTLANNRAAAVISGVRDRLRVLLITGSPHQGGRVWRDLLKSDPSVDLVHFTILRPPDKQDFTPIEELSLIAFPTRELFVEKLDGFDLIIFDQYERRGVLPLAYFDNMARFVDRGGALLIAAGPPFAGPASLFNTPLASVLPVRPTGEIDIGRFVPKLTRLGLAHAVTAPLAAQAADWGSWQRLIEADARAGEVLMEANGKPLLVLDRVGEGRTAVLLSDQLWLWARGHEGGGPYAELVRRTAHWLMKEPELEEERLDLTADGTTLTARLRTLEDRPPTLEIETPDGAEVTAEWNQTGPGQFAASLPATALGLYAARAGRAQAAALNGPANPLEFTDLRVSAERVSPLAEASGGAVRPLGTGAAVRVPELRAVGARADTAGGGVGGDWIGLRQRDAYSVRETRERPLAPGLPMALLILAAALLAWWREGR